MAKNNGQIYCLDTMVLSFAFLNNGATPLETEMISKAKSFIANLDKADRLATTDINIAELLKAVETEEKQKKLFNFITDNFIIIPFNSIAAMKVAILFRSLFGKYPKNVLRDIQLKDDLKILASLRVSKDSFYSNIEFISEDDKILGIGNDYGIKSYKLPSPPAHQPDFFTQ